MRNQPNWTNKYTTSRLFNVHRFDFLFWLLMTYQCESIYWISDRSNRVRGRGRGWGDNTVIIWRSMSIALLFDIRQNRNIVHYYRHYFPLLNHTYMQMNPVTFVCITSSPDSAMLIEMIWWSNCKPVNIRKMICDSYYQFWMADALLGWTETSFVSWSSAFIPKGINESGKAGAPILNILISENRTSNEWG